MSKSYVEYNIDDIQLKNLQKFESRWSSDSSLLAVSVYSISSGGTIKLVNENGFISESTTNDISSNIPSKSGAKVTSFAWHPKELTLAVIWENGDLGCFTIKSSSSKWSYAVEDEEFTSSLSPIVVKIDWINGGDSLMTVINSGTVKIFSFDGISRSLIRNNIHQLTDTINDAIVVKPEAKHSVIYFGSNTGMVYQLLTVNDGASDIIQLEHPIRRLLYYSRRNRLIIITENLLLCQFTVSTTSNDVAEVSKVKLSSSVKSSTMDSLNVLMIDKDIGLIAICVTGERVVKLWQLETGHNAAVIVVESVDSHWAGVSTLDYCNGVLVAGTSNNQVIVWRRSVGLDFNKVSQLHVKGNVRHISAGKSQIACCTNSNELYLIEEQTMSSTFSQGLAIVQTGAKVMKAFWLQDDSSCEVKTETPIRHMIASPNGKYVAVKTTGIKETYFYKAASKSLQFINSWNVNEPLTSLVINENIAFNLNTNFSDSSLKSSVAILTFDVEEGNKNPSITPLDFKKVIEKPTSLHLVSFDLNANFLLVVLACNECTFYFEYELKGKSLQLICGPSVIECRNNIKLAKINCGGTLVAFVENKHIVVIKTGSTEIARLECDIDNSDCLSWAFNEERLVCFKNGAMVNIIICSIEEMVIRQYDQFELERGAKYVGFEVPHIYSFDAIDTSKMNKRSLTEFEGLSLATIKIMIDFLTSTSLDLNQMIKTIDQRGENNEKLWTNLARISVKCRDINMGLYCVAKLKDARIVLDVKRELAENSSPNAALAVLAMNVGLNSEAEELLKASGNGYMLSKFYQTQNQWTKAIECVDKLNSKTVYYDYAKYLENEEENLQEAIKYYEKSATNVFEVPRMLFDIDGNSVLQNYCLKDAKTANDEDKNKLVRWWGQYSESLGDINGALNAYEKANDYYNFVRLLCYTGESEKAKAILQNVRDSENSSKEAALLHIGRHEETNNPPEAISYYLSCGAISHAIRVCRMNNMNNDLIKIVVNYGTKKDAKDLIDKYVDGFEDEEIDNEIIAQLYCKAGATDKAMEFCFQSRLWSVLRQMLKKVIEEDDSNESKDFVISDSTLEHAFDALRSNSDIVDIVIDLLLLRKDKKSLIPELIAEYNIEINEGLFEKIEQITRDEPNTKLVELLAETSLQQGQYITAAKLFNSIGDRVSSIKALIRTGQDEKVINYANIARDKSVYKICANYLQTVNFQDKNTIAKFYKKANAKQELERFLQENQM